jgi:uncharacterized protein
MLRTRSIAVALLFLPMAAVAAGAGPAVSLSEAVKQRDADAVRSLLKQGVDVNAREADGSTALLWAAHNGDLGSVDLLLRAGASASAINRYGATPLGLAVKSGNAAVVESLLKGGADPNAAWAGGETVLMTAARAGRDDVVKLLIARGAKVDAREEMRGQTALMWAAAEGHADVIHTLVAAGADMRAVSHGPKAGEPAAESEGKSRMGRRRPVARLDTFTPMQFAVHAGRLEAVKALADERASLADETPNGMGLITLAIANAHYDVAAVLAEKGADVNQNTVGFTPLHQLVRVRTLNIGQFFSPIPSGRMTPSDLAAVLVKHGANLEARTTKNFPDGHRGAFGLGATPFLMAAKGGDVTLMKAFAELGADVRAVNVNGTSALMAAAGVEMFNPNEDSGTDADGFAALQLAVQLGAGDINSANKQGDTPLHGAVFRATTDAMKFLVEHGAKMDVKNKPKTCEQYSAGCIASQNKDGYTPYELAMGGLGMLGSYRPDAAAYLREAMIARGTTVPDFKIDQNRYKFGVTVKQ